MTAPDAGTPDPADVELVADEIARSFGHAGLDDAFAAHESEGLRAQAAAHAALSALAATGRLLPADAKTRTEWGTRLTWDDGPVEDLESSNLAAAQRRVELHARNRVEWPNWRATAELIQRTHWVGPWQPAPTDTEES